jgi:hypothetical protein
MLSFSPSKDSRFNPCFPTSNPYVLRNAIPIKYHEVSVSTGTQSSFPMFNAYTSNSYRRIQKISSTDDKVETHLAGLKVAHLMASPNEHPVKRAKLRIDLSMVITLVME